MFYYVMNWNISVITSFGMLSISKLYFLCACILQQYKGTMYTILYINEV
jgi:hypothetical protein